MTEKSKIPPNIHNTSLLRSMARRRGIELKTRSQQFSNSSRTGENRSSSISGLSGESQSGYISKATPKSDVEILVESPDKPSTDLRRILGIVRRFWMVRGRIRLIWRSLFPRPTPDELELREFLKSEREINQICKREITKYIKVINLAMLQIGNSNNKKRIYSQMVRWTGFTRDEGFTKIVLVLDLKHVPEYVLFSRLNRDHKWTDDLTMAVGLPVHWAVGDFGVTLTIDRPVEDPKPRRRITVEDLLAEDESL